MKKDARQKEARGYIFIYRNIEKVLKAPNWVLWKKTFYLFLSESHARPVFIEKFNPGFLKDGHDPVEGFRSRTYRPIEAFHAADGATRDPRALGQLALRPAKEGACRANMSACNPDQGTTLTW